jgi:hypothetical protein
VHWLWPWQWFRSWQGNCQEAKKDPSYGVCVFECVYECVYVCMYFIILNCTAQIFCYPSDMRSMSQ